MRSAEPQTGRRRTRIGDAAAVLVGCITIALGAGAATHVLLAPAPDGGADTGLPAGAPTIDLVLVRTDTERILGETANGDFVTIEFAGTRGAQVAAAAHEFMHGTSARVARVAVRERDGRRFAIGIEPGPEDFPGVDRPAPRPMDRATFEGFEVGVPRSRVLREAGPPHLPGVDQGFEGRRADCFEWRAVDRSGSYRLCFDQTSAPRLLGRSYVDA